MEEGKGRKGKENKSKGREDEVEERI